MGAVIVVVLVVAAVVALSPGEPEAPPGKGSSDDLKPFELAPPPPLAPPRIRLPSAHDGSPVTMPPEIPPSEAAPRAAWTKRLEPAPAPAPTTRACPFCAETIQQAAIKCRFCGEFLDGRASPAAPVQQAPGLVRSQKSRGVYIILGLFLGGAFGIHNFYADYLGRGVAQMLLTLGTAGFGLVIVVPWVLLELLTVTTDGNGDPMA